MHLIILYIASIRHILEEKHRNSWQIKKKQIILCAHSEDINTFTLRHIIILEVFNMLMYSFSRESILGNK